MKGCAQVHRQRFVPRRHGQSFDRVKMARHSIVHEHIDAAVFLNNLIHHRSDGLRVQQIGPHERDIDAV